MTATQVEITAGRLEGEPSRGVIRFKGIPYAAPPVGDLRFAAPEPVAPWSGVRQATGKPPLAPQPLGTMEAMAGATSLPPQSEADCLTLNVWTESLDGSRPVMVWIHGGAFVTGTGTTPWYDGANLARRGVVVVTINYRLGPLGFLHLEPLGGERFAGAANAGLLDQALALRWVNENIAQFGGDPDQVTIFGESAGGMSVGCQLALPAAAGLFRAAIAQSGAAANVHSSESGEAAAVAFLAEVGLDPSEVKKLVDLPVEALMAATTALNARGRIEAGLPFCPTVDGTTLPQPPVEAVRSGAAAGVSVVTGWNAEEMRLFTVMDHKLNDLDEAGLLRRLDRVVPAAPARAAEAYREVLGPDASRRQIVEAAMTDRVFRIPAIRLLEAHAGHGRTHAYEFRYESPSFGAAHAVEIPFAFDNLDAPGASFFIGDASEEMRALSATMADHWVSVAVNEAPAPDWPEYHPHDRPTMLFDLQSTVANDPGRITRELWD